MREHFLVNILQHNNVYEFCKEIKLNNKLCLPSTIEGVTGDKNIAEIWRKNDCRLFILCKYRKVS